MKKLRRTLVVVCGAGLLAGALRLRDTGKPKPEGGGWRELSGPDLS